MGIDHYLENQKSLDWPDDLNVSMCTYSMLEWQKILLSIGFANVSLYQFGAKEDWAGTLVLYAEK